MATSSISCTIPKDANYPNLKEVSPSQMRREIADLFAPGEEAVQCFQTIRDQVIFTNKRVFIVNVQGVTGKKVSYFSYPYSKVQYSSRRRVFWTLTASFCSSSTTATSCSSTSAPASTSSASAQTSPRTFCDHTARSPRPPFPGGQGDSFAALRSKIVRSYGFAAVLQERLFYIKRPAAETRGLALEGFFRCF